MACPQQQNIATKRLRKLTKYRQLAFETRERRTGYNVMVVPLIIGALGGGMRQIAKDLVHVQNFGGVASHVPWGWRDSYGKTGNFGKVGDKSMFKMYKKAGVGREGDI